MRKHRIKFPMILKDGAEVNRLDALREHFDLTKIIGYFNDGQLVKWLDDRFYHDEMDAIKNLAPDAPDFPKRLCEIFEIPVDEKITDEIETIAWRNERLTRLRTFTSDENILRQVDFVAFDQDDFEDITREEDTNTIYLCNNIFEFPSGILRRHGVNYIGIGNAEVVIHSKAPIDFAARRVTFKDIKFDAAYEKICATKTYTGISEYRRTVTIPKSMNQRRATALAEAAASFNSTIRIIVKGKAFDLTDTKKFGSLYEGTICLLEAHGDDSKSAVDTIINMINEF